MREAWPEKSIDFFAFVLDLRYRSPIIVLGSSLERWLPGRSHAGIECEHGDAAREQLLQCQGLMVKDEFGNKFRGQKIRENPRRVSQWV